MLDPNARLTGVTDRDRTTVDLLVVASIVRIGFEAARRATCNFIDEAQRLYFVEDQREEADEAWQFWDCVLTRLDELQEGMER